MRRYAAQVRARLVAGARTGARRLASEDQGSAVVEFVTIGVLMLVPVVYLVVAVASVQAAAFATESAAREAARIVVTAGDQSAPRTGSSAAVGWALRDHGIDADPAQAVTVLCATAAVPHPRLRRQRHGLGDRAAARRTGWAVGRAAAVDPGERHPHAGGRRVRGDAMRRRRRAEPPHQDDSGQVLLLALAYGLVAILLVLMVVAASAVHLDRKRLLGLADAAALDAADAVEEGAYFDATERPDGVDVVPLTDRTVRDSVLDYLERQEGSSRFVDLAVDTGATGTSDGQTAVVVLTARSLPLLPEALSGRWAAGVPLRVTASASSRTAP